MDVCEKGGRGEGTSLHEIRMETRWVCGCRKGDGGSRDGDDWLGKMGSLKENKEREVGAKVDGSST